MNVSLQQLSKAEKVVRLELERREAKKRLVLFDTMLGELDQQLVYVAQFKKEWLLQRQTMERDRQKLMREEVVERERREKQILLSLSRLQKDLANSVRLLPR